MVNLTNRKLALYVATLLFILASPFFPFLSTPQTIFEAAELVPTHRLLASEMKRATKNDEPLDILFLARSSMQNAIDPKLIEEKLNESGQKYRIYMAGLREGDVQGIYLLLKEFLNRRSVNAVILSDAFVYSTPGLISGLFFEPKEYVDDWRLHTEVSRIQLFKMAILAAPLKIRNTFFPMELEPKKNGKMITEYFNFSQGRLSRLERLQSKNPPDFVFRDLGPERRDYFSEAFVSTLNESVYPTYIIGPTNQFFVRRMIEMCVAKGTKFYFHHEPLIDNPDLQTRLMFPPGELDHWNQKISGTLSLPWGRVFSKLKRDEAAWYFANPTHLNDEGSSFYSQALVPALEKLLRFEDK